MKDSKASFGIIDPSSLDKIDRLFECGVGEQISLPQLVVVGDQSSGKSSVLEGLTELPFPRDSGLCTRFATQITFRRSPVTKISVSVIAGQQCSEEHRERLKQWRVELERLDAAAFALIMKDVNNVMGIDSADDGERRTFSDDILRLEIEGPDQEHFSIIDIPGIFRKTTAGVTTKEDIAMVNHMVRQYMKNPRSVMLTIIPANVDIATQDIMEWAEEVDPEGLRTLGVLTKPDLVDRGAEKAAMDLIEGKTHALLYGWHILRNPSQAQLTSVGINRHEIETDFFRREAPWNRLSKDKTGVPSLRIRLQEIMANHIRREFPGVKKEIGLKLKDAKQRLQRIGSKRQTTSEQLQFMTEIAGEFQHLVSLAVRSEYGQNELFDRDLSLRLATAAVDRGQKFSEMMAAVGRAYQFNPSGHDDSTEDDTTDTKISADTKINTRLMKDHVDIIDLIPEIDPVSPTKATGILKWLKDVHSDSRGFELGTFKATLLGDVMKKQCEKWQSLCLGYISDIIVLVHSFITKLLREVAPDETTFAGIAGVLTDHIREKYQNAIAHTRFLLEVELGSHPATHNPCFSENLDQCRQSRQRQQLEKKSVHIDEHGLMLRFDDILKNHPLSNSNHEVMEIHDILRSYYEVAQTRFVDCMRMQVADYLLITGPSTPLGLFSSNFVAGMTSAQLEEIAGESPLVKRQRADLEKEIQQLEEGRKILA